MSTASATARERSHACWLALTLTPALGAARARKLVERMGGLERVFHSSLTELEACGIPAEAAQAIFTGRALALGEEESERAATAAVDIIALDDAQYPQRLKQIYDPPLVLYVRGDADILSQPGIAMVGTRHPTPYGTGMAERLGTDLAAHGLLITSGMARGVDTASHRGALRGKGRTVAVFGTGVDVIYPR